MTRLSEGPSAPAGAQLPTSPTGTSKYPREVRIVPAIPLTSVLKTDRKWLRAQPLGEAAG
jgi:acyl-coenzyme A synthetase/AMP-(fatty) acid ligase